MLLNCRTPARYFVREKASLEFALKPVRTHRLFEPSLVKGTVMSKSPIQIGVNKSTLWCMKERLESAGSIRLHEKTRQRFNAVAN